MLKLKALYQSRTDGPWPDPLVPAALAVFSCADSDSAERAQDIINMHLALAALSVDEDARPIKRGRGRPPRDKIAQAAVRGAMHWLSVNGRSYASDWNYTDRAPGRGGKRSTQAELEPRNGAKVVADAIARAGLAIELSEIRSHMKDYIKELNHNGTKPSFADYIPEIYVHRLSHQDQ